MKIAVIQIEESYVAPAGTIHFGTNGWMADKPEKIRIHTNLPLPIFIEKLAEQSAGLLGEGELVLAVFDPEGQPVSQIGVREYQGRILFSPEE